MLRKLRVKFIIINMTIVCLMLGAIFAFLYYTTRTSLERESLQLMTSLVREPLPLANNIPADQPAGQAGNQPAGQLGDQPAGQTADQSAAQPADQAADQKAAQPDDQAADQPKEIANNKRDNRMIYFVATVDSSGAVSVTEDNNFNLEDEDEAEKLIKIAAKTGQESGTIQESATKQSSSSSESTTKQSSGSSESATKQSSGSSESATDYDYELRFLHTTTPDGERYIFTDISAELSMLNNLKKSFAMIGLGAFIVFLLISYLLARWAVHPVERAWQQQKQFVADASHELKTPLTVILADAELLKAEGCTEEERHRLTDGINTMAKQMRGLVENLLDLARMENRESKTEKARFGLSEVVTEASLIFEPIIFEHNKSFHSEIEENISMNGDAGRMKQLVDILLDNALKYSIDDGDISLKLKRVGNHINLCVSNKSAPLSDKDIEAVFDRFYRADKAREMNQSYGLGLSIARSIVEDHKGKIKASREGDYFKISVDLF